MGTQKEKMERFLRGIEADPKNDWELATRLLKMWVQALDEIICDYEKETIPYEEVIPSSRNILNKTFIKFCEKLTKTETSQN